MRVRLAYGDAGIAVDLPAQRTVVVEPRYRAAAADPAAELARALRAPLAGPPLADLVRPGQRVAISLCDGTRPQPRELMLPAVLAEIDGVVDPADVVLLVATGTHRGNTPEELAAMLGPQVWGRYRVVNHDARDPATLVDLGVRAGDVPVRLDREWVDADLRITTGFVEPHFFAGFSGGPKLIAPGLAGLDTVLALHDARRIGDPRATWGVLDGNPVHEDLTAAAAACPAHFTLDVLLNRDQQIVAAYGGATRAAHRAACAAARELAMAPVDERFDVVLTTNSGYPLDQNLYQAVKGMSAAAQVVKPGGLIVCAAECRDGFPDHGSYRHVLSTSDSPAALLKSITEREQTVPDQWQVQIQAKIQLLADVTVYTGHLSAAELAEAHLGHTDDIEATVGRALAAAGSGARLCVLPEGPQTIPYVDAAGAPPT